MLKWGVQINASGTSRLCIWLDWGRTVKRLLLAPLHTERGDFQATKVSETEL